MNTSFGPVLLCSSHGCGKTTIGRCIHNELANTDYVEVIGANLNDPRELYSTFLSATNDTTIFIDECHSLGCATQDYLLKCFSEKRLFLPKNRTAGKSHSVPLSNFTIILATTHEHTLMPALRSRIRLCCRLEEPTTEEIAEICYQRAKSLKWDIASDQVLTMIAERSKNNPRQALSHNLLMCWNVTRSRDRTTITLDDAKEAFSLLQVDELGLDKLDRLYLRILYENGPCALNVLSSIINLPTGTIQRVVEPYLLNAVLITKGRASVRIITAKGASHLDTTAY